MNQNDIISTHYGEPKKETTMLDNFSKHGPDTSKWDRNHGEPKGVRLTFDGFKNKVAQAAMIYPDLQKYRGQFNNDYLQRCYDKEMTPDEVCKQMLP